MPLTEKQSLDYIEALNKKGKDGWREVIYYSLTEKFIEKYIDKLDIDLIFNCQDLSYEFKEKYKNYITIDNRDSGICFWCGIETKIHYYRKNRDMIFGKKLHRFCCRYCPVCLR